MKPSEKTTKLVTAMIEKLNTEVEKFINETGFVPNLTMETLTFSELGSVEEKKALSTFTCNGYNSVAK